MNKRKLIALILSITTVNNLILPTISVTATEINKENIIVTEAKEEENINNISGTIVHIPDLNLKIALNQSLGQAEDSDITTTQLEGLTNLDLSNRNITNLTGLEKCINLRALNARDNKITDITSITNLINLTSLLLDNNNITDISSLDALDKLTKLTLNDNKISDISVLLEMNSIKDVYIINNNIETLPILDKEFNILNLSQNKINDISPLSGITITRTINLSNQDISGGNFVADDSTCSIDNIIKSVDGSPILPTISTGYDYDDVNNKIILNNIYVSGGRKYKFHETVIIGGKSTVFNGSVRVEIERTGKEISIPDSNLQKAINDSLGKASTAPITNLELQTIKELDISNKDINSLEGLENCHKLEKLIASGNNFTSLEPIKNLTNLKELNIAKDNGSAPIENLDIISNFKDLTSLSIVNTGATDISFISGLNKLIALTLRDNNISDLTPLTNKDTITRLYLQRNDFTDISALGTLDNLEQLFLSENNLNDITSLSNLKKLTRLHMNSTNIGEVESISGLTNLTELLIGDNNIVDMNSLSKLTNIERLSIFSNPIKDGDISFVRGLTKMREIYAHHNEISDISPLASLKQLTHISLNNNKITDLTPLAELNIKSGYLENQKIILNEIKSVGNLAIANNIVIKDRNGNALELKSITNNGVYNQVNNSITWDTITSDSKETMKFVQLLPCGSGKAVALYSGVIEQPIKYSEAPIISGVDNISIKEGEFFNPIAGITATDKEDEDLTSKITITGNIDINTPGKYELTYTVKDSDGNITTEKRIITVNPVLVVVNQVPTITAENKTITVGDKFDSLTGVSAEDKEDGDLTSKIKVVSNNVNVTVPGIYEVIYEVKDSKGAKATKIVIVTVEQKDTVGVKPDPEKPITDGSSEETKPIDKLPNTGSRNALPLVGVLSTVIGSTLFMKKKKKF